MRFLTIICAIVWGVSLNAQSLAPREGWVVMPSAKPFETLLNDVKLAARENGMGIVTEASPTQAAASRGVIIPNNRVVGIFNNVFAVRILNLSTAALIEAPIRLYFTEDAAGRATLSYKTPSHVFAPYLVEGGEDLARAASELDLIFATIAAAGR